MNWGWSCDCCDICVCNLPDDRQITVDVTGLADGGGCTNCTAFNTTYLLDRDDASGVLIDADSQCAWQYVSGDIPDACGGLDNPTIINVVLSLTAGTYYLTVYHFGPNDCAGAGIPDRQATIANWDHCPTVSELNAVGVQALTNLGICSCGTASVQLAV